MMFSIIKFKKIYRHMNDKVDIDILNHYLVTYALRKCYVIIKYAYSWVFYLYLNIFINI